MHPMRLEPVSDASQCPISKDEFISIKMIAKCDTCTTLLVPYSHKRCVSAPCTRLVQQSTVGRTSVANDYDSVKILERQQVLLHSIWVADRRVHARTPRSPCSTVPIQWRIALGTRPKQARLPAYVQMCHCSAGVSPMHKHMLIQGL